MYNHSEKWVLNMKRLIPLTGLLVANFLFGCEKKSSCEDLALAICNECSVSDFDRDVRCGCLEDGEVNNGSDYFQTPKDAEVYCSSLKSAFKEEHLSEDRLAQCAGDFDVIEKYGDDACEPLGYRDGDSSWDTGGYYSY